MSNPEVAFSEEENSIDMPQMSQRSMLDYRQKLVSYKKLLQIKDNNIKSLQQNKSILKQQNLALKHINQNNDEIIRSLELKYSEKQNQIDIKNTELARLQAKNIDLIEENTVLKVAKGNLELFIKINKQPLINFTSSQSLLVELQEQKKISARLSQKVEELQGRIAQTNISSMKQTQGSSQVELSLQRLVQQNNMMKKNHEDEIKQLQKEVVYISKCRNIIQNKHSNLKTQNQILKKRCTSLSSKELSSKIRQKKFIDIDSEQTDQDKSTRCNLTDKFIIMELEEHLNVLRKYQKITFLNMLSTWSEQKIELELEEIEIL